MDNIVRGARAGILWGAVALAGILPAGRLAAEPESATPAAPPPAPPAFADWRRLEFRATKFLIASARSVIERWPADRASSGPLVRVVTEMSYLGKSARLHHAYSVLPPSGPLPARWMELDPGKKARETTVDADGRLTLRRFGLPPGAEAPWSGPWSAGKIDRVEIKHTAAATGCGAPVDAWVLLTRLDCLLAAPEVRFVLLSNDGGHVVIARRADSRQAHVGYASLDDGTRRRADLDEALVELLPGPGEPDPSVFGMDGGVKLWIDVATGAPVEIDGRREGVGAIRFRLTGVGVAPQARPAPPWPTEAQNAALAP